MRCAKVLCATGLVMISVQGAVAQTYTSELGNGLVFTVTSLKRSGMDSIVLKGNVENTGSETASFSECNSGPGHYVFRVDAQDPVGKKQYQQIKVDREYVGSQHASRDRVQPKQKVPFWARITAPPAEVEKVTLIFSCAAPPIEDVPLQK